MNIWVQGINEPMALKPVKPSRYFKLYGFRFGVWRKDQYHLWDVAEASSGLAVPGVCANTIAEAIDQATTFLKRHGPKVTRDMIAKGIALHGRAN